MKILILHSGADKAKPENVSAVDLWRIVRPYRELKKHVDWQIDEAQTAVLEIEKFKNSEDFTPAELEKSALWLKQYDIVHCSYFSNAAQFALLMTVQHKYGTKLVMDIDDDMFSINPDNPFWMKMTDRDVFLMQQMIRNVDYITTTTDRLAHEIRQRRPDKPYGSVSVVPNFITDDYKETNPDNGDKVVIGYFGGASHFRDLNETGAVEGITRAMHKHKNVYFKTLGMLKRDYVPTARYEHLDGVRGEAWAKEKFPTLSFDICICPLEDTLFARGKSNIKWQESTRLGAAVIASNVGPYKTLFDKRTALLVPNDPGAWMEAVEKLVTDIKLRKLLVENSRELINKKFRLEDHWTVLKDVLEKIHNGGRK